MAVGEALRRLCEEVGWSYAVFWKAIGAADPVHLVWEDGYCGHTSFPAGSEASEALPTDVGCAADTMTMCSLVKKVMASQVHVVGEGTVGRAAFTGNHEWIIHGTAKDHGLPSEVAAEMSNQFRVGIQTIAIIPVLPRGVLQLGSTRVVMENKSLMTHAKKLCSQLNNRSSMAVSSSVKTASNHQGRSRPSHGASNVQSTENCSKKFSQFPVTYEQYSHPDTTAVSGSTSLNACMNASTLKIAQLNGQAVRDHISYSKPDVRFIQQAYREGQLVSNAQSIAMSSDLISSSLASGQKQPLFMNNIGQLEFCDGADTSADLHRNALLKPLVCLDSFIHENRNINISHGIAEVSNGINGHGNFDYLLGGARLVRANLSTSATSQVLDQRNHSVSGMLLHRQPLVSCELPQSSELSAKMGSLERGSFQIPSALSSESDFQISNGLNANISQENQFSVSNHICQDQNINRVNDLSATLSTQKMNNMDGCRPPSLSVGKTSPLFVEQSVENDLFDILGPQFHHLCHNVGADLVPWTDAKPESSDRDVPESSIHVDSSLLFSSRDNELYSGMFSLTDSDQLLDAVISNVNPAGKQSSDDSASCKTSLTDIPGTSYLSSKEMKQCGSSGIPSALIKHESGQFIKQPCLTENAEDGCLSQNNGMHKSQIRLWIESGKNMKCESASASNSKGLDTPNKSNRKRSRPGESPRPRPKDRQLIQDRIKELREMVPNGAKCSIDALLEKTVKHMLFLQSVTKHADKLKDSTESKILGSENGPVWKDYFEGGATWAFDVGSQSMTCPIIVEDLDRPHQMLVEMICEDRGIFLEIADFIKGLGLTILRGAMEARKSKIWARFTVEANRNVTRMEIFLSLVRLLEPNCDSTGAADNANNVNMPLGLVRQPVIPATGRIQ
ncbi:transcription factor LHW-like [Oryza brachyantha]|uniref:BHLH domain-containing protein n=1 Tax=Oryza brachyantha TaxID=4533 RepID=J3N681_ORYBR|nr:transcription factor LHW-like [Oryza brachyantha]